MYLLLNTLWFIWMLKYVLFWLYLWQLKEYHIGRFTDHFRTYKGKQLVMGLLPLGKIFLLMLLLAEKQFFTFVFYALLLVYIEESFFFVMGIIRKSLKRPVPTAKTILLTA